MPGCGFRTVPCSGAAEEEIDILIKYMCFAKDFIATIMIDKYCVKMGANHDLIESYRESILDFEVQN